MAKKLGTEAGEPVSQEGKPDIEIDEEAMKLNFS